jgi:hypothetical protein
MSVDLTTLRIYFGNSGACAAASARPEMMNVKIYSGNRAGRAAMPARPEMKFPGYPAAPGEPGWTRPPPRFQPR